MHTYQETISKRLRRGIIEEELPNCQMKIGKYSTLQFLSKT